MSLVPDYKMAFFNDNISFDTLQDAWTERKMERTRIYANMLYETLEIEILGRRRESIYNSMLEIAHNADRPSDLYTTLWTYNHAYVSKCPKPFDYLKAQNKIVTEGLAWSIGRTIHTESPASLEEWEWTRSPMPIDDIIRNSDVLDRLSLLFGDHFLLKVVRINLGDIRLGGASDPVISRRKCRLDVHYFPKGVRHAILTRRDALLEKYPIVDAWGGEADQPFVWTGLKPKAPPLPPPLPPPQTPPSAPPLTEPPPIRPRPSHHDVHYYGGGIEALRAAADDTLADCIASRERRPPPPCHCCYSDDWSEDRYNADNDIPME